MFITLSKWRNIGIKEDIVLPVNIQCDIKYSPIHESPKIKYELFSELNN